MNYKVESLFIYKGYMCVVTLNDHGYRCGYVSVSNDNKLYGLKYTDYLPGKTFDDIKEQELGKRSPLTLFSLVFSDEEDGKVKLYEYFDVHGSLTYSSRKPEESYPVPEGEWWFGFDCGHWGDIPDVEACRQAFGIEPEVYTDGEVRTVKYVEKECKLLVDQFIEFEKR